MYGRAYGIEYARSATSKALLYTRVKAGSLKFGSVWNRMESMTRTSLNGYAVFAKRNCFAAAKQDGTNRVWAWAKPSPLPKTAWAGATPVPPLLNDWGYALYGIEFDARAGAKY